MGKHFQEPLPKNFESTLFEYYVLTEPWEGSKPTRISDIKRTMGAPVHGHHFGRWVVEAARLRGWELRLRKRGGQSVVDCLRLKTTIP